MGLVFTDSFSIKIQLNVGIDPMDFLFQQISSCGTKKNWWNFFTYVTPTFFWRG